MSILELIAAALSLIAVILTVRKSVWCWPVWIVATTIYALIFFDVKLYADFILQLIFIPLEILGWYQWAKGNRQEKEADGSRVGFLEGSVLSALTVAGTIALTWFFKTYTNASFPFWDSFAMALSLAGTWLQTRKILENWLVFVLADAIYIGIYIQKSLWVTAVLYLLFLAMAVAGYISWKKVLGQKLF